jgi:hypothetical protein
MVKAAVSAAAILTLQALAPEHPLLRGVMTRCRRAIAASGIEVPKRF